MIKYSAQALGKVKRLQINAQHKSKDKPWFDKECRIALARKKKARWTLTKSREPRARAKLWEPFYQAGMTMKIIILLHNLYYKASARVRLRNGDKTDPIAVTQGVLQGDALSPLLLGSFLRDLIDFFKSKGHTNIEEDIGILLFADDRTIVARDAAP
ncbi:hypothetical protein QAD02_014404 [Eretmocerus hayati]|uniref:Uncharacterized protein n=1 Tax=Eretmocerus hayati TaxID=131215 RepID=A0ACC2P5F6_9HYME|nr:hypothetical protein QAD02_014404 [Eretmocerus hayati]